ncbi:MAG: RNA polymerase sigma factor [Solirubrobacterales bacterium]
MPMAPTEDDLIAQAQLGDHAACEALMRGCNRRLFRLVRAVLGSDAEAEDVLQDSYIRAFASLKDFAGRSSFQTWLSAIALNEARGRLRRRRELASLTDITESDLSEAMRRQGGGMPAPDPEDAMARTEMRRVLEHAIDDLPPHYRSVFVLRAVEQLSVRDTAEALGIPEDTVKTRFHRARRLLRQSLGEAARDAIADIFRFDGVRCDRIVAAVLKRINPDPPERGVPTCERSP